eukprot:5594232-Prymnesium_polylepis.2
MLSTTILDGASLFCSGVPVGVWLVARGRACGASRKQRQGSSDTLLQCCGPGRGFEQNGPFGLGVSWMCAVPEASVT